MKRWLAVLALPLAYATIALAETDPLVQAVQDGLSDRDPKTIEIIDRQNCIFKVGYGDTLHLNDVYVDLISIEHEFIPYSGQTGFLVTRLRLEGEPVIREERKFDGKEDVTVMHKDYSTFFYNKTEEDVRRAWKSIYAQGCVGKRSKP